MAALTLGRDTLRLSRRTAKLRDLAFVQLDADSKAPLTDGCAFSRAALDVSGTVVASWSCGAAGYSSPRQSGSTRRSWGWRLGHKLAALDVLPSSCARRARRPRPALPPAPSPKPTSTGRRALRTFDLVEERIEQVRSASLMSSV